MRSQAGLRVIALIIILIISSLLVSAAPVPTTPPSSSIIALSSDHGFINGAHPLISTSHSVTTKNLISEDNRLVRRSAGAKIKKAFQNVGSKIKSFVKNTGAKVAKFGLKVASTIQNAASKVANFIPGVGKIIGKGLQAESKVTGVISDKIHANLGTKLQKGMNVMNKANKVMKYIPG